MQFFFLALTVHSAFFAILMLQSGMDKLFHYKDNLAWLKGHFANTFLGSSVPALLLVLTCLELGCGLLFSTALVSSFFDPLNFNWFQQAYLVSGLTFLSLFLGQRIAKDYAGAASLAGYFVFWFCGPLLVYLQ